MMPGLSKRKSRATNTATATAGIGLPSSYSPFEGTAKKTSYNSGKREEYDKDKRQTHRAIFHVWSYLLYWRNKSMFINSKDRRFLLRSLTIPSISKKRVGKVALLLVGIFLTFLVFATVVEWQTELRHVMSRNTDENDSKVGNDLFDPLAILPRRYDVGIIQQYWAWRPASVAFRLLNLLNEISFLVWHYIVRVKTRPFKYANDKSYQTQSQQILGEKLKAALTRLGPTYIKLGQQSSLRPDIFPPPVILELQKLQDAVPPFEDSIALDLLQKELKLRNGVEQVFGDIQMVATASLGQVYRAKLLETEELVAIKIQRPDLTRSVTLDMYLMAKMGRMEDSFLKTFTNMKPFLEDGVQAFAVSSYKELDYENEARNQMRMRAELHERDDVPVHIPIVYPEYTTRRILTTEWIDGVKITSAPKETVKKMLPIAVNLFTTQLLDIGLFHADPHPGNIFVRNDNGMFTLMDFGLCVEIDEDQRKHLTETLVHVGQGDMKKLIYEDGRDLGFYPEGQNISIFEPLITPILKQSFLFKNVLGRSKQSFGSMSSEMNQVLFDFPFHVPSYVLVLMRGFSIMEAIATEVDAEFNVFMTIFPFALKRMARAKREGEQIKVKKRQKHKHHE